MIFQYNLQKGGDIMQRTIINDLRSWKESKRRKPLVLMGARQVGKTYILKEFGNEFKDGYIYINFDRDETYGQFFKGTKDVKKILQNLSLITNKKITEDTLLILDEIGECEDALLSLKYFCEDAPEIHIAAAGSLLGLALQKGFPVGKVDFLSMGPMTFTEFLMADGKENFAEYLSSIKTIEPILDAFNNTISEQFKIYMAIGGMPEVVSAWVENHDLDEVDNILDNLLIAYEKDFGKHVPISATPKIHAIWNSIPSQLARENKKFLYSLVRTGARAREYEDALGWLEGAGLVNKEHCISKPGIPLSAYSQNQIFKIYMVDVGLLRRFSKLPSISFIEGNKLLTEFKGALTENYVYQALIRQKDMTPYYWTDGVHEVDFVIQKGDSIIPIETKSGFAVKTTTSIKNYLTKYNEPFAIRLSMKNLSKDGSFLNIPIYLLDNIDNFL